MAEERKIRVLMSKPGVDGHWRGIVTVSRGLRDAGMEVIFGGFQSIEQIVETAIEEDVDVIGLSFLGGEHIVLSEKMLKEMKEKGVNVPLLVGGVIPKEDLPKLKRMGVKEVFISGIPLDRIAERIREVVLKAA